MMQLHGARWLQLRFDFDSTAIGPRRHDRRLVCCTEASINKSASVTAAATAVVYYVTLALMTSDMQTNGCRIEVESYSCNS